MKLLLFLVLAIQLSHKTTTTKVLDSPSSHLKEADKPQQDPEIQEMDEITRVLIYNQRKKKVLTALFYETIGGGGLLYADKYILGNAMLFFENALLIGSAFTVDHPGTQKTMLLSVLGLKIINSFWTLYTIHKYNTKIARELKVNKEMIKRVKRKMKRPRILNLYSSFGIQYWEGDKLLLAPSARLGTFTSKDKIYLEGFYATGNYTNASGYMFGGVSLNYQRKFYRNLYFRFGLGGYIPNNNPWFESFLNPNISYFWGFEYSMNKLNLGVFNAFSHKMVVFDREDADIQDYLILNLSIDVYKLRHI